ncbi:hypothetical protein SLEP1_g10540 [Rubroshorea leprosula]|uniref:Protein kinase domain-containing protein n=1 Tax=Rubroshorea leprosula TaxID=152421 RepID=A0AAV5ICY0_9ROSI|nr:hypothetical protein SLEP1_g10540 [Rubroshorea leprosula]
MSLQNFFKFLKQTSVKERRIKPSALPEGLRRQFSLAELKAATNNFHHDLKIGEGGFGPVYKGLLDGGSLVVAVKRFSRTSRQAVEVFRIEVQVLCQLRHQNLVSLLGFCHEKDEGILVLEICIGATRGLHYLHTSAKYALIHRDVSPLNILLDENWDAKLSDFGYIAPEYLIHGELSEKHDVYSLGIALLEVLCGRNSDMGLISVIIECIKDGHVHVVIDPFLKGKIAPVSLIEYVEIALNCVYADPNERPSMGEVEVTLELALELQEKADLVIKADNPYAVYAYEDVSFRVSVEKIIAY